MSENIYSGHAVWWACWQKAGDRRGLLLLIPSCHQDIPAHLLPGVTSDLLVLPITGFSCFRANSHMSCATVKSSRLPTIKSFSDIFPQRKRKEDGTTKMTFWGKRASNFTDLKGSASGFPQFAIALSRHRIFQNLWQGKHACDMLFLLVEHFNGYVQLSQWDLTFLEQEFVTAYLTRMNSLPKSTRKELAGRTLAIGKLWHVWRERMLGGGATSVSKCNFLSSKQALLFPADVLPLPCSNAKMFYLVRSQGKEILLQWKYLFTCYLNTVILFSWTKTSITARWDCDD